MTASPRTSRFRPASSTKKGRLWLDDGSCVRLRLQHRDPIWSYDFVEDRTHDGRKFRTLKVVDEFTRECLAFRVGRKLTLTDVIDVLSDVSILRGGRAHDPHRDRRIIFVDNSAG